MSLQERCPECGGLWERDGALADLAAARAAVAERDALWVGIADLAAEGEAWGLGVAVELSRRLRALLDTAALSARPVEAQEVERLRAALTAESERSTTFHDIAADNQRRADAALARAEAAEADLAAALAAARHTSEAEAGARALDDFAATWVSDWSGDLVPRATVKHALRDRAAALRAGGGA